MIHRVALALLALAGSASADSVLTRERTLTRLAEGVYEIRHPDAPDTFPQGNTTVVIGERGVLVVDSTYLPSAAREDIADIRRLTSRPVRWLVNTHWHYDHTLGNGAYAAAFPDLTVIAHEETARQMAGYNPGWFARYPTRGDALRKNLAEGRADDGRLLSEAEKREIAASLPGREPVAAEFAALVDRRPDLTFDQELRVDLGGRVVEVKHLGRGNTAGDAVVYLPAERILVAGDLLDHPVPYLGGGYPFELVETLVALSHLEADVIVPGHGDVLHDKVYLGRVIGFLRTVTAEVRRQVHLRGNSSARLEEVRAAVHAALDVPALRQQFAGDDKDNQEFFDDFSMRGVVTAAFAEAWVR